MDSGNGLVTGDSRTEGYVGGIRNYALAADDEAGEVDPDSTLRDTARPTDAGGFHAREARRDPLLALVATLGYSRASYVTFGAREDASALCMGLGKRSTIFGGVPEHVLSTTPRQWSSSVMLTVQVAIVGTMR